MFLIALYEIDRVYGGPEEGGWWYDTGTLERVVAACRNEDQAYAKARRINNLLDRLQRHKRPVGSVIYNGGRHQAHVCKDVVPAHYPETRPTYE